MTSDTWETRVTNDVRYLGDESKGCDGCGVQENYHPERVVATDEPSIISRK